MQILINNKFTLNKSRSTAPSHLLLADTVKKTYNDIVDWEHITFQGLYKYSALSHYYQCSLTGQYLSHLIFFVQCVDMIEQVFFSHPYTIMKILFNIYFFSQSSNLLNQARLKILKTREDLLKVSKFFIKFFERHVHCYNEK